MPTHHPLPDVDLKHMTEGEFLAFASRQLDDMWSLLLQHPKQPSDPLLMEVKSRCRELRVAVAHRKGILQSQPLHRIVVVPAGG